MTKKYKSVEHTIRNVVSKQPVDEGILDKVIAPVLGAATTVGGKVLSGAKSLGKGVLANLALSSALGDKSATSQPDEYRGNIPAPTVNVPTTSPDTSPKPSTPTVSTPMTKPPTVMPATLPKAVAMPAKGPKSKKTVKEETLDEMGFIGTDKFHGNPRAFTRPVPKIEPGRASESKGVSGARRMAKQQMSPTMHGKVHEDAESEGTKKRKEIENVGRPTSGNTKLAKQGEIKTKIIDEAELAGALIKAVEDKKKTKKNGNPMVEFNPKLKHVVNENK